MNYAISWNIIKMEYNKIMTGTTAAQAASWFRGEMFEEEKNMMTRDWNARGTKACVRPVLRCLFLLMIFTVFMGITAFAAAEKIDTVKLSFTCDPVPKAGEAPGTVTAKTGSREFTVKSTEYTNDVEVWGLGDKPRVRVVLEAADGYRFSYTTSSHFKLSGRGADFIKAKISDSGSTLNLECYLSQADGKPGKIQGLDWSGFRARWDKAEEDIKHYEVRLYRNRNLVTTVTASGTSYDFRNEITRAGDYTFRVRSIARYGDTAPGRPGENLLYSLERPVHFAVQITPPAAPIKEQSRHTDSLPFICASHQTSPASPTAAISERSSSIFPDQNSKSDHLLGIKSGGILSSSFHARNKPAKKNTAARMNAFALVFALIFAPAFAPLLPIRTESAHTEVIHRGRHAPRPAAAETYAPSTRTLPDLISFL